MPQVQIVDTKRLELNVRL